MTAPPPNDRTAAAPAPGADDDLEGALAAAMLSGGMISPDDLAPGGPDRVGRYEIVRRIGDGASSEVFLARDPTMAREVAVKVLVAAGRDARARFEREVRFLARLDHPGILAVHDSGLTGDGTPFLVMELIGERSLATADLELDEAVARLAEVARACAAAHAEGIIHHDLKPGNVLLGERGAVVCDFGIAKLLEGSDGESTRSGAIFGTPSYMAPEQLEGRRDDPRSDVYAIGAMLYELLCGQPPHRGRTIVERLRSRDEPIPDPRATAPDAPATLVTIARRALAPDPGARFGSAAELAEALEAARAGSARPRPSTSTAIVVGAVAGAFVLVIAIGAALGLLAPGARPDPEERRKPAEAIGPPTRPSSTATSTETEADPSESTTDRETTDPAPEPAAASETATIVPGAKELARLKRQIEAWAARSGPPTRAALEELEAHARQIERWHAASSGDERARFALVLSLACAHLGRRAQLGDVLGEDFETSVPKQFAFAALLRATGRWERLFRRSLVPDPVFDDGARPARAHRDRMEREATAAERGLIRGELREHADRLRRTAAARSDDALRAIAAELTGSASGRDRLLRGQLLALAGDLDAADEALSARFSHGSSGPARLALALVELARVDAEPATGAEPLRRALRHLADIIERRPQHEEAEAILLLALRRWQTAHQAGTAAPTDIDPALARALGEAAPGDRRARIVAIAGASAVEAERALADGGDVDAALARGRAALATPRRGAPLAEDDAGRRWASAWLDAIAARAGGR